MPRLILGFVGPMVAGKGTACKYLEQQYGAQSFRFSSILRDVLDRLYLPHTRDHLQRISLALRETFDDDILARTIAQDVQASAGELVTVDGVRRLPDIKFLRPMPGFFLIAIAADERTRYERIIQRGENSDDRQKTFADFAREGQQEAERHIAEVAATADCHLDNNGTFEQLHQQLDTMLQKLRRRSNEG